MSELNEFGLPKSEVFIPRTISNAQLGIPEYKERKPRKIKPYYKKPDSIVLFEIQYQNWLYRNSKSPRSTWVYYRFSDDSANALTKIIMQWMRINGYHGARVNTGGTWDNNRKMYIRSGSTRGAADISAIVNGRAIEIEVKFGNDKMRPAQLEYKKNVEDAGGIYFVAKNFDGFLSEIVKYI